MNTTKEQVRFLLKKLGANKTWVKVVPVTTFALQ